MNIGKSIQHCLINKGMQKIELAELMGISPQSLSRNINKRTCSLETLDKLCEIFELKSSEFIAVGE